MGFAAYLAVHSEARELGAGASRGNRVTSVAVLIANSRPVENSNAMNGQAAYTNGLDRTDRKIMAMTPVSTAIRPV
jgi:hypothetical protein